jgi:Response regulator receiver domain
MSGPGGTPRSARSRSGGQMPEIGDAPDRSPKNGSNRAASSGMAHDFSNILAVIVGYNDLVTSGLDLATAPIRTNPSLPGTDPICVEDEAPAPVKPTKRILVVEDDISIRRLSTEMLIRSGYQVDAAADGAAGWKALQGKSYDLVITDNFMPEGDRS